MFNMLRNPQKGLSDDVHQINRIAIQNVRGRIIDSEMLKEMAEDRSEFIAEVLKNSRLNQG